MLVEVKLIKIKHVRPRNLRNEINNIHNNVISKFKIMRKNQKNLQNMRQFYSQKNYNP